MIRTAAALLVATMVSTGCEQSVEERAKAAAHAAIKREDERVASVQKEFAARRDAIVSEVKGLVAAKKWDAASLEASKWRLVQDPEMKALEAIIDAEKEKIFKVQQVERNRVALAERLAREKEEREQEKRDRARRKREGVRIGMTQEEVVMSSWGRPEKINRSVYKFGVHEQWVYPGSQYLYFEDGKLTSLQTSR